MTALIVLSERDPALDLPEEKRYAAAIYGKTRDHSAVLREGMCETLVLLAIHGNNLFRGRLGYDVEARVHSTVRELLMPFAAETWASQKSDLPLYAEAAPDLFLDIVEQDLQTDDPKILSLLKPISCEIFGSGCPRSGLCGRWNFSHGSPNGCGASRTCWRECRLSGSTTIGPTNPRTASRLSSVARCRKRRRTSSSAAVS